MLGEPIFQTALFDEHRFELVYQCTRSVLANLSVSKGYIQGTHTHIRTGATNISESPAIYDIESIVYGRTANSLLLTIIIGCVTTADHSSDIVRCISSCARIATL